MKILDTDVLIDIQRNHRPAIDWFATLSEPPCVPGFVIMELIQDARNAQEVNAAMKLVAPLPIIWPNASDCSRALLEFSRFHLSDGLGLLDALIAACVIGHSATLYTFNVKHYRVVPGLTIEQPYTR